MSKSSKNQSQPKPVSKPTNIPGQVVREVKGSVPTMRNPPTPPKTSK